MAFALGVDSSLLADRSRLLDLTRGRRVALLGHPASMTSNLLASPYALRDQLGLQFSAFFGPQHGIWGEKQDNMMESEDFIDPNWNIPVFSLYGKVRRPTSEMVSTYDVLLIDLQDVGTRIYTYVATLRYCLEESAKARKSVIILDRPNPIGRDIEGPLLDSAFMSFVGEAHTPMKHGLTIGELALWMNERYHIQCDLHLVRMSDYEAVLEDPQQAGWPSSLPWINPSPNAASLNMARVFPGSVLIEGCNLSEGRGTTRPLECVGFPGMNSIRVLQRMELLAPTIHDGVRARPFYFLPTFHKFQGETCAGIFLHTDGPWFDAQRFQPLRWFVVFLRAVKEVHPEFSLFREFHYEYETERLAFDLITGSDVTRHWIEDLTAPVGDYDQMSALGKKAWSEERQSFLRY